MRKYSKQNKQGKENQDKYTILRPGKSKLANNQDETKTEIYSQETTQAKKTIKQTNTKDIQNIVERNRRKYNAKRENKSPRLIKFDRLNKHEKLRIEPQICIPL